MQVEHSKNEHRTSNVERRTSNNDIAALRHLFNSSLFWFIFCRFDKGYKSFNYFRGTAFLPSSPVMPAKQTVSQLTKLRIFLNCHSGLNPWFDRLTTLSKVEGESSAVSGTYVSGCRIKSGMTGRK
jgi:hypothetical protein